jgi:Tol biopolymer transport system component
LARAVRTRFTFDPADELTSIWSPDGTRVAFNSRRKGHLDLYKKASSGAGTEEILLEDPSDKVPNGWSADGRFVLFTSIVQQTGAAELWVLPLFGDRKPYPFMRGPFNASRAQFSPDGHWVAYISNASGHPDVYVVPFPDPSRKWQITAGGGEWVRWRRDGGELVYMTPTKTFMATSVNTRGSELQVGATQSLFTAALIRQPVGTAALTEVTPPFDLSADGQRLLINGLADAPETTANITLLLNWTAALKK